MRVGILVPSIGDFGKNGYYNLQEIGLAKALDSYCDKILVWRLIANNESFMSKKIEGCKNATMNFLPSFKIGTNGIVNLMKLDVNIDVLICFADTQISIPFIFMWTKKNKIRFIPYIGVIESHSTNHFIKKITNSLFERNLKVYKKNYCLAKTPSVQKNLEKLGVKQISVAPVGLDKNLLNENYRNYNIVDLKKKYGYKSEDKLILFIGRMITEKQPIKMIEIFSDVVKLDNKYKLLMVGTGKLKGVVVNRINIHGLRENVQLIDRIPNSDIWELYRISEVFVNLNQQEIYGMAILEAMYYECKVVAWKAPGPEFIIENGISGWIVNNNREIISGIMDVRNIGCAAHQRIMKEYLWESTAKKMLDVIGEL